MEGRTTKFVPTFKSCQSMKGQVKIFENAQFGQVRTAGTSDKPLFCLADVCKALGIINPSDMKKRLNQRGVATIYTPTYNQHGAEVSQSMLFINEPNLYRCVFQSRKKEAEAFQNWVFEEVLPSIRAKGSYALTQQLEQAKADYDRIYGRWKELCGNLNDEREKARGLEKEHRNAVDYCSTLRSKLQCQEGTIRMLNTELAAMQKELDKRIAREVADRLTAKAEAPQSAPTQVSGESCCIPKFARLLRSRGIDTGKRRLLNWLRTNGYLHTHGSDRNYPTGKALERDYFEVKTSEVVVTPQGQSHIIDRLLTSF